MKPHKRRMLMLYKRLKSLKALIAPLKLYIIEYDMENPHTETSDDGTKFTMYNVKKAEIIDGAGKRFLIDGIEYQG